MTISESHNDTIRIKMINISDEIYFVTLATDLVSKLAIYSIDFKQIYKKEFPSDVYVVDFDLIFNGGILILIIEDCTMYTRDLMVIDFTQNEYI